MRELKAELYKGWIALESRGGGREKSSSGCGLTGTRLSTGAINQDKCISLAMIADRDDKFLRPCPANMYRIRPPIFTGRDPRRAICNFRELNNFPFAAWRRFAAFEHCATRDGRGGGAVLMIIGRWSISGMESRVGFRGLEEGERRCGSFFSFFFFGKREN